MDRPFPGGNCDQLLGWGEGTVHVLSRPSWMAWMGGGGGSGCITCATMIKTGCWTCSTEYDSVVCCKIRAYVVTDEEAMASFQCSTRSIPSADVPAAGSFQVAELWEYDWLWWNYFQVLSCQNPVHSWANYPKLIGLWLTAQMLPPPTPIHDEVGNALLPPIPSRNGWGGSRAYSMSGDGGPGGGGLSLSSCLSLWRHISLLR